MMMAVRTAAVKRSTLTEFQGNGDLLVFFFIGFLMIEFSRGMKLRKMYLINPEIKAIIVPLQQKTQHSPRRHRRWAAVMNMRSCMESWLCILRRRSRQSQGTILFCVLLFLLLLTLLFQALCRLFLFVLLCYESFRHGFINMILNALQPRAHPRGQWC